MAQNEISTPAPNASSAPPAASAPSIWQGDQLLARSIRFTVTVMTPLVVTFFAGPGNWVAYALITGILAFTLDMGGPRGQRLGWFAAAAITVLVGGALGTLVASSLGLTVAMIALTGLIYGLVESLHPSAAFSARFFTVSVAVGALYLPVAPVDVAIVAAFAVGFWLFSIGWDAVTGTERPSTAPHAAHIIPWIRGSHRDRWIFAVIVALAIVGAFLAGRILGVERPYWALLAVVVVLGSNLRASWQLTVVFFVGTVLGVAVALVYGELFTAPGALVLGITIAALIRWPAQTVHGIFGIAALTVFVMLLLQLVAEITATTSHALADRIIDVSLGCVVSVAALGLDWAVRAILPKAPTPSP